MQVSESTLNLASKPTFKKTAIAVSVSIALGCSAFMPAATWAQAPSVVENTLGAEVPAGAIVKDVRIEGLQRIEPGTIFSYLPIQIGDRVTQQSTAEAVKVLFATGFFTDVQIALEGSVMVILLEERPAIGAVEVSGSKEFDKDQLVKALKDTGLAESRIFDRSLLERAEQELKRQYLGRGKYNVRIISTVTPLERNRVAIQIAVDEGEDARIKKIQIVGSKDFSEKRLLSEFKLTTPGWMTWYTKSDQYSRQKLTGDLETLRSFYLNQGYLEFAIDSTQVSLSPDRKDVFITIVINEGEKFKIDDVRLVGDMLGREKEFKDLVKIKKGETFSNERLQVATKAITDRMGELGYAFANVSPLPEINRDKREVTFVLQVDPGRRVYVRNINISGNAKTRDEVIRREMRQFEAAWYDADRIRQSRNRIDRLGYFNNVTVDTAAVPGTPDQVDINVNVEERPLGALTLGVGFSSTDNLVLSGSITQQNFLGTGTNVAMEVNTSKARQVLSFSHIDPYWTDDGVSRSISLYTRKFQPDELNLGQYGLQSSGLGIRFGLPYTDDDRISFGLSYESTKLSDVSGGSPTQIQDFVRQITNTPTGPLPSSGDADAYILSAGWSRDTRDSGLAPTRGRSQYLNFDYATPLGKLSYGRLTYGHQYFYPLGRSVTLALNADLSYGFGLDKKEYPVLKNFYAGGIGSIRGFSGGAVGAYDDPDGPLGPNSGAHTGGNRSVILNSELLFPFPGMGQDRSMRLFTFVDAGNVWAAEEKLDLGELRASAGFGLSWLSPVGPLKLSFGWPLRKFETDEVQKVQFQIGTGF